MDDLSLDGETVHVTLGTNVFDVKGEFTDRLALAFTQWVRASSTPAANDAELADTLKAQAARIGSSATDVEAVAERINTTAPAS